MKKSCGIEKPLSTVGPDDTLPRNMPLVIYDGDCGFCINTVRRWITKKPERIIDVIPFQFLENRLPEIDRNRCAKAVHLVDQHGVSRAADAVLRIRAHLAGRKPGPLLPFFAMLLHPGYWLIAHNRGLANRIVFGKRN